MGNKKQARIFSTCKSHFALYGASKRCVLLIIERARLERFSPICRELHTHQPKCRNLRPVALDSKLKHKGGVECGINSLRKWWNDKRNKFGAGDGAKYIYMAARKTPALSRSQSIRRLWEQRRNNLKRGCRVWRQTRPLIVIRQEAGAQPSFDQCPWGSAACRLVYQHLSLSLQQQTGRPAQTAANFTLKPSD